MYASPKKNSIAVRRLLRSFRHQVGNRRLALRNPIRQSVGLRRSHRALDLAPPEGTCNA
jgi:hypothetical protein